jgi:hypothetical protein
MSEEAGGTFRTCQMRETLIEIEVE